MSQDYITLLLTYTPYVRHMETIIHNIVIWNMVKFKSNFKNLAILYFSKYSEKPNYEQK